MTQSCDVSCRCRFQTFGISRSTTKILSAVHVTTARSSAGIVDSMHHETLGQLDGFAFMACWLHGHTLKTPILSNHILSMCADHLTLLSLCLSNKAEYSLECFNLRLSAHSFFSLGSTVEFPSPQLGEPVRLPKQCHHKASFFGLLATIILHSGVRGERSGWPKGTLHVQSQNLHVFSSKAGPEACYCCPRPNCTSCLKPTDDTDVP